MIIRTQAWAMWLIAAIFFAYQYILRVIPNIMMPDITKNFNIDEAIYGQFSGIYYIGYSLAHLPLGAALDRFGPKKIMPICILLTAIGMLPLILSTNASWLIIGRLILGMGSSAAILGLFKIIRLGFPEEQFSRMLSIAVTIGLCGAIYGGAPVNYLREIYGYKTVITAILFGGGILATLIYVILPKITYNGQNQSFLQDIKNLLSHKKLMFFAIFSGLMVGPLEGFADVWGAEFLNQIYHLSSTEAAGLCSVIFLGMCFGAPLLSFIADKSKAYYTVIITSALLMMISFILIITGYCSTSAIIILFAIIGALSSYQIMSIYLASTFVRQDMVAITTAMTNMVMMIFGYIFHSVIGKVISLNANSGYDFAYKSGISVIPVALAIAAIGLSVLAVRDRKN